MLTTTPAYVVPADEIGHTGKRFSVGTGPFILNHGSPAVNWSLRKRENYFDGSAKVKGIVYRIIPEDLTASS